MRKGFILAALVILMALFASCASKVTDMPVPNVIKSDDENKIPSIIPDRTPDSSPDATNTPAASPDATNAPVISHEQNSASPSLSTPTPTATDDLAATLAPLTPTPTNTVSTTAPVNTELIVSTPTPAIEQTPTPTPTPSATPTPVSHEPQEMVPLTEAPAMFKIDMPKASGTEVLGNEKALIDASNKKKGYVMVKYQSPTDRTLKVIMMGPSGTKYTYNLNNRGDYDVFPLSDGNGVYNLSVYENISGNKYSTACQSSFDVKLNDQFAPFIRPNQYVNYSSKSKAVIKANELTANVSGLLPKIAAVYHYVIENISYDKAFAEQVRAKTVTEYLPNIDSVYTSKKGICFDYAALMTAMLRSQGIPTKLVVGYSGSVYHAWINAYSDETGWVDTAVYFDGKGWKLMDPTYASSGNSSDSVMQYIGNGSNYQARYLY